MIARGVSASLARLTAHVARQLSPSSRVAKGAPPVKAVISRHQQGAKAHMGECQLILHQPLTSPLRDRRGVGPFSGSAGRLQPSGFSGVSMRGKC